MLIEKSTFVFCRILVGVMCMQVYEWRRNINILNEVLENGCYILERQLFSKFFLNSWFPAVLKIAAICSYYIRIIYFIVIHLQVTNFALFYCGNFISFWNSHTTLLKLFHLYECNLTLINKYQNFSLYLRNTVVKLYF